MIGENQHRKLIGLHVVDRAFWCWPESTSEPTVYEIERENEREQAS